MKKYLSHFFALFIAITLTFCFSTGVSAKIEWDIINTITLENRPLDIAISSDGTIAYILCKKNILLFSTKENKIIDTLPVTDKFSQIALSPDGEKLFLTHTTKKHLSIIQLTQIYEIEVGQSPIIGKVDAPVSVFVFLDYQ
jgi:DNA-binding beta-propeller fold protein YncE